MLDQIPLIPRLDDWLGVWSMEISHARTLLAAVRGIDWQTHLARHASVPMAARTGDDRYGLVDVRGKQIAVIPVVGTLMKSRSSTGGTSTVETRQKIRAASQDAEVSGILLRVDSPGGTVAGTHALASEIAQARRFKPVVAQIEDTGASAAYWIASQAQRVYASSPTTLVGSIGTMLAVEKGDPSQVIVFRSGPHKAAGMDGEISEDQAAHLQGLVNDLQAQFSAAVSSGRRLNPDQLAEVATGAVWLAGRAQQLRLLDGIQPVEQTLDQLASMK